MNIANCLSALRLFLSFFILWAFATASGEWVLLLWGTAAVTDILDGWAARKRGEITELGKILDPLADKLVTAFSLAGLVIWCGLPRWIGWVYLTKEVVQLGGGLFFLRQRKKVPASNLWGKTGTVLFFAGFFLYYFFRPEWGVLLILPGLAVSIIALGTYAAKLWEEIKD